MVWLSFLKDLPFSLLVTSLAVAPSALPVSTTELTKDNFATTIGHGLWFIGHFSPYSHHCISFKPTWDELVIKAGIELPSISLAQVNCAKQGDLCSQNDIMGYPTMKMFDKGKVVGEFKGARDIDRLMSYIKTFTDSPAPTTAATTTTTDPLVAPTKPTPVAPHLNLQGEVLEITSVNFHEALAKGPAFIKFFAPWCAHCKKMAPVWKQLAGEMKGVLTIAQVNCDDQSNLCKGNRIERYPTLIFFNGENKLEYNEARTLEQLRNFAEKAATPDVQELASPTDLYAHIASESVIGGYKATPKNPRVSDEAKEHAQEVLEEHGVHI